MKKPVKPIGIIIILITALLLSGCGGPSKTYENAQKALVNGEYEKAAELFDSISTYEDSSKLAMYSKALLYGEQKDYAKAIETLGFLGDFKDSAQLIEYYGICKLADSTTIVDILSAADQFDAISAYRDSAAKAEECRQNVYDEAVYRFNKADYDNAIWMFEKLGTYKDCEAQLQDCINADAYAKADVLYAEKKYDDAAKAFKALGDYKDSSKRVEDAIEAKNADAYAKAEELLESGDYDAAISAFKKLGNYNNSFEKVEEAIAAKNEDSYNRAGVLLSEGKYYDAYSAYNKLGDYLDSSTLAQESKERGDEEAYVNAQEMIATEDYEQAINILTALGDYKDSRDMLKDVKIQAEKESQYQEACSIVDSISFPSNKDVEEARNIFISLGDYKDSKDRLRHFKKVTLQEGNKGENSTYYYNAWGDVSLESIYSNTSYILRSTNDISDAHFSESNKIDPDWEMKFDENGNLIHDVIRRREYNYTYNSDGKVISCNNSFFWEYNDDGTLARCYDTTGTIERTYEYNSNGELIHLYWYREDVSITCYDEYYTYDDSGNLIEQRKQYRSNDGLGSGTDKTNYTYDEFGNLIKKVQYYGRGSNFAEEYTYEYSEDRVTITSTIVGKPHTKSTDYCYYIYGYIWVPNIALD